MVVSVSPRAEADRAYRLANADRIKAQQRLYRDRSRTEIKARQKAHRDSERGRAYRKRYADAYYAVPSNRMRLLVNGAIVRAKKRGLPFDEDLRAVLMGSPPKHCACCTVLLDYSMGRGKDNTTSRSPSLDRTRNDAGYTLANVQVLCMRCNHIKGTATLAELEAVVEYLRALG